MSQKLDFTVEELEDLETPWDWGHFFMGAAIGVALVGIGVGVAVT
ncbi:hypothetical protein QP826_02160 [Gardnerella swidsinskii]|jgi:hypothetical protein|nr:daptide-type RiPP [Gardnerella swidsinskii]MDK8691567.1 hypothetical protein [Gardnerella swidsinskii]